MKYIMGAVLMSLAQISVAAECSANGGPWFQFQVFDRLEVPVTLSRTPGTNRLNLNNFTLDCRFSAGGGGGPGAKDDWETQGGDIPVGPKLMGLVRGLNVKGTDYIWNVPSGVHVATTYKNGSSVRMPLYMFVNNARDVHLRPGDLLATINMRQNSNVNPGTLPRFELRAANELAPDVSTCTINGNAPINVNFNEVDLSKIGESASSTQVKSNVRFNYSCTEPGFTLPVKITFTGTAAGFNSNVLAMSNVNLGTALLRGTTQIKPGTSFNSTINDSTGGDNMTFALIRKVSSTPASGAFSGSATIVMGYQ